MATYTQIASTVPQYSKNAGGAAASGYFIKFYADGTTTPISMATDSTGGTLLVKSELDSLGYPTTDGSSIFTPYIDQSYKLALYTNETDADNNTFASAVWVIDNIGQVALATGVSTTVRNFATLADAVADTAIISGSAANVSERTSGNDDGGMWDVVLSSTVTENGSNIVQCTGIPTLSLVLRESVSPKRFSTLADAVASPSILDGDALNIAERSTGNGGGAMWDVVLSSTVTENTYNIVQCTGISTLSLVLRIGPKLFARPFGAVETDNKAAIQAAIDYVIANDKVLDGENITYDVIGRITIPNNARIENLHLDFDDSDSTDFQLWFGNSTDDSPTSPNSGYTGEGIHVRNMQIKPSRLSLRPVRFRGLIHCSFTQLNIAPTAYQDAPVGVVYVMADGMVNSHWTECNWRPSTGYNLTDPNPTEVMRLSQMLTLDATASAGNNATSTSSTFNGCYFHLATKLGSIYGDDITFNDCILESANEGWTIIETGSIIEFNNCYWEKIALYKIYARGVDHTIESTRVHVNGGKVQCDDDNGSQPDHAFAKVKHCFSFKISGTVFQGAAQTRLIEIASGGSGRSDCLIYQDLNVGAHPRNQIGDTIASKTLTITNTSPTISVAHTDHGLLDGDIIDIIASNQSDPYLGVNQLLPNLVVTRIDDDNFTVESNLTASGSGSSVISYRKYRGSSTCLANMDKASSTVVTRGNHQITGSNSYIFNDADTEFVEFRLNNISSAAASPMLCRNGSLEYVSNDTAYIKSIKYIDAGDFSAQRQCDIFYGGNEFTSHEIFEVRNETAGRQSSQHYIKPYKIHPYEPLTVTATTAGSGGNFPRDLVCIIEIAHTGMTYDNDTPK